jgi:HEAT repeat protein
MRNILYVACGLAVAVSPVVHPVEAQPTRLARTAGVAPAFTDPADSLYRAGRTAVTDADYRRAATLLKQVVDKYPNSAQAGDALYWRAWALYHLGVDRRNKPDLDDALQAIDDQQRRYAKAATSADARSLRAQIRSAQAGLGDSNAAGDITTQAKGLRQQRACSGSAADEETRIAALEGLMSMNADDAVPILKDVLKQRDACRVELRKKAVWLISQKRSADIVSTLLDVARNDPSMDVRTDAVFWLSQTRSEQVIPALDSILFSAGDEDMRKKAIFSLSQFRDERARQSLRRAVEDERLPEELRGEAVFWLGNSPSNTNLDYFKTLFRKTKSEELRSKVVQAVSKTPTPEAMNWLLDVAKDKSYDTETRKNAIFWAAQRKSFDFDQLATIYSQAKGDEEIQHQVLFVYSQRREPAAVDKLMDVAKNDPSVDNRKQALFWLGQKNDPRIRQFIRDLINK